MAKLSIEPLNLAGGCNCHRIRYTISIPQLKDRPIMIPSVQNNNQGDIRSPDINFDHCNQCRTVSGAIVQCWFTCPQTWVSWKLDPTSQVGGSPFPTTLSTKEILKNEPSSSLAMGHYKSSESVLRYFCKNCGTNLAFCYESKKEFGLEMIDLVLGSMDRDSLELEGMRPSRHSYWSDGLDWVKGIMNEGDKTLAGGEGRKLVRHPQGSRIETCE